MKHLKYAIYLLKHKSFVLWAGLFMGVSPWRLLVHDWSKFMLCEWLPYAEFFYGTKDSKSRAAFHKAWLHHIHLNKHHWNYWVLDGKPLPMPEKYIREMVSDWMGVERTIAKRWSVVEWYGAHKSSMLLEEGTRRRVEELVSASEIWF